MNEVSGSSEKTERFVSLEVTRTGLMAEVKLLGPTKGNALGPDFWHELPIVFTELDKDPDIRVVVLTGKGPHFSYGLDLPAMMPTWEKHLTHDALAKPRTEFLREIRALQQAVDTIADTTKPVIAAISGWCIGGGLDLISAADIRIASAEAKFSLREVKMAMVADLGSLQRLSTIIGEGHLRELALTGKNIDAAYAERIGLVNHIHPTQEAALAAAHNLAEEIAANPPLVVQGIKDVLSSNTARQIAEGQRYVSAWNAAFLPSVDLSEAVRAFMERREPHFQGE